MDSTAERSYARYPHLHDDHVAFVAADDVWLAPLDGGRAWRLTADREKTVRSAEAFIRLSMIHLMLNRLDPKGTEAEFQPVGERG